VHNLDQEAKRCRDEELIEKFRRIFATDAANPGRESALLLAALGSNKSLKWCAEFESTADLTPLLAQLAEFMTANVTHLCR
jgi:hypothetical protein